MQPDQTRPDWSDDKPEPELNCPDELVWASFTRERPDLTVCRLRTGAKPLCPNVVLHAEESQLGVVLGEGVDGVPTSEVVFLGDLGASDETMQGWVVLKVTWEQNLTVREKIKPRQFSYRALGVRSV